MKRFNSTTGVSSTVFGLCVLLLSTGASASNIGVDKDHQASESIFLLANAGSGSPLDNVDAALIRKIQTRLGELGYDVGRADGLMGARTYRTIFQFKIAKKLPVNNWITPQFLEQLGVASVI